MTTLKMPAANRPAPAGFTLIEVGAVLALTAILAAAVAVSLKDVCRAARVQFALDQARSCDLRLRMNASRHGRPTALAIDIDKNALTAMVAGGDGRNVVGTVRLGRALKVDRVVFAARSAAYGRAVIDACRRGTTPTYAVRLIGSDGSTRWFVFAGLTGQITELRRDFEVNALFEALSSPRPHELSGRR